MCDLKVKVKHKKINKRGTSTQNIIININGNIPNSNTNTQAKQDSNAKNHDSEDIEKNNLNKKPNTILKFFQIVGTPAKTLATKNPDGALVARMLTSTIMHIVACGGYILAIVGIPYAINHLINMWCEFTFIEILPSILFIIKFVLRTILSFVSIIFVILCSKSLRVDAFQLEQNKDTTQVYSIAVLVATIIIGILTLS